jgi:hypothetical protein
MILYLPASLALSSISRFHCFSGTRIVIEVSYGSLALWGPLYFQNCCSHMCVFSCFLGSSLFPELLCTFVYVLFVLWLLSIFRIALCICMWSTWSHHCYSWMSDLWWPNPHTTPLIATKQHVVNSLSLSLCKCTMLIHGSGLQWLGSWVLVFELLWGILSTVHCRNQDLWRERENSFRHGLCLNFSLVFALSQMHTYVCVFLVFSITFMGSCLQGSLFWNWNWMAGCKVYYRYVRMSQENASSNLDITMVDRLMTAITWMRSPELGGKAINT